MKTNLQKIKTINDFEYIRILRNKSYVRLNSFNKKIISKNDHKNWLKKNKKNYFYIIKKIKKNIGYIRINEKNFVSWALEKKYWGQVQFSKHLKRATCEKKVSYSCAILKKNIRSQIAALKAGFVFNKIKNEEMIFKKKK